MLQAQRQSVEGPLLVLLTNDDGIDAPGLASLAEHLAPLGEIIVATQYGAVCEVPRTHDARALRVHSPKRGWFSVSGTPADCVYIGVHHLCDAGPTRSCRGSTEAPTLAATSITREPSPVRAKASSRACPVSL